jgi:hypothetical protein
VLLWPSCKTSTRVNRLCKVAGTCLQPRGCVICTCVASSVHVLRHLYMCCIICTCVASSVHVLRHLYMCCVICTCVASSVHVLLHVVLVQMYVPAATCGMFSGQQAGKDLAGKRVLIRRLRVQPPGKLPTVTSCVPAGTLQLQQVCTSTEPLSVFSVLRR